MHEPKVNSLSAQLASANAASANSGDAHQEFQRVSQELAVVTQTKTEAEVARNAAVAGTLIDGVSICQCVFYWKYDGRCVGDSILATVRVRGVLSQVELANGKACVGIYLHMLRIECDQVKAQLAATAAGSQQQAQQIEQLEALQGQQAAQLQQLPALQQAQATLSQAVHAKDAEIAALQAKAQEAPVTAPPPASGGDDANLQEEYATLKSENEDLLVFLAEQVGAVPS